MSNDHETLPWEEDVWLRVLCFNIENGGEGISFEKVPLSPALRYPPAAVLTDILPSSLPALSNTPFRITTFCCLSPAAFVPWHCHVVEAQVVEVVHVADPDVVCISEAVGALRARVAPRPRRDVVVPRASCHAPRLPPLCTVAIPTARVLTPRLMAAQATRRSLPRRLAGRTTTSSCRSFPSSHSSSPPRRRYD